MEMMKVGAVGVIGVLLAVWLKNNKAEYGFLAGAAVCLVIFSWCMDGLFSLVGSIEMIAQSLNGSGTYVMYLLKAVGITYLCDFSSMICKDAGYHAVAGQIEVFGKISVLLMGLPVLTMVIQNIGALSLE